MSNGQLSAPVGRSPREGPGAKVANKAIDVLLVQTMLHANGFKTPITGTVNTGMIKAIEAAQRKLNGKKVPDGVADPGGALVTAMKPKYQKYLKEVENIRFVRIPGMKNGQMVPEAEFKKHQQRILKEAKKLADIHQAFFDHALRSHEQMEEVAHFRDGFFSTLVNAVVFSVGRIKPPSKEFQNRSRSSIRNLRSAIAGGDFASIEASLYLVERSLNSYSDDLLRYSNEMSLGIGTIGKVMVATQVVGWASVGAVGAPALVATTGMSAAAAAACSAGGIAYMQTMIKAMGTGLGGGPVNIPGTMLNAQVDALVAAANGAIGSKLPDPLKKALSQRLSGRVAGLVSRLTGKKASELIMRYLSEGGTAAAQEALAQAIKTLGKSVKNQKMPTEKELYDATGEVLFKFMAGGFLKNLGDIDKKYGSIADEAIKEEAINWTKKNAAPELTKKLRDAMIVKVVKKQREDAIKRTYDSFIDSLTGKESRDEMRKKARMKVYQEKMVKQNIAANMLAELNAAKAAAK